MIPYPAPQCGAVRGFFTGPWISRGSTCPRANTNRAGLQFNLVIIFTMFRQSMYLFLVDISIGTAHVSIVRAQGKHVT